MSSLLYIKRMAVLSAVRSAMKAAVEFGIKVINEEIVGNTAHLTCQLPIVKVKDFRLSSSTLVPVTSVLQIDLDDNGLKCVVKASVEGYVFTFTLDNSDPIFRRLYKKRILPLIVESGVIVYGV